MTPRPKAGSLGFNTAANFVSQFIAPALGLLLIPVYLHFIGLAGYGLVALLAALLATTGVVTRGLGWSLQREVAQAHSVGELSRLRRLVSTFAAGYWAIGATLGLLLLVLSKPISGLLDRGTVSRDTVWVCLILLSLRIGTLFPTSVYQAVLLGTRRQVLLNLVTSVSLLVGSAGTIAGIAATHSVVAFYLADLLVSCATLLYLRRAVAMDVGASATDGGRFLNRRELRALAGLSSGLVWIQAVGILIRQLDRFVVGALTSLASLGVYTAGIAGGRLLSLAYNPYLTAVFPESCALAKHDISSMPAHVINNSRIVALTSIGVGVPVALAAHELLTVWTQNERVADAGAPVLVIYVIGTMFLALADTENQAQTAMGTSRCAVFVNTCAIFWLPPTLYLLVRDLGIQGAAVTWLLYGSTAWMAHTGYTFGRLMPGNLLRYLRVVSVPSATIVVLNFAWSSVSRPIADGREVLYVSLTVLGAIVSLVAAAAISLGPRSSVALLRRARSRLRSNV
jgi:O-antigen/teichoic acid export membrane protein